MASNYLTRGWPLQVTQHATMLCCILQHLHARQNSGWVSARLKAVIFCILVIVLCDSFKAIGSKGGCSNNERDKSVTKFWLCSYHYPFSCMDLSNGYDLDEFIQGRNNYYHIHGTFDFGNFRELWVLLTISLLDKQGFLAALDIL